jgi:hypothetical protein
LGIQVVYSFFTIFEENSKMSCSSVYVLVDL